MATLRFRFARWLAGAGIGALALLGAGSMDTAFAREGLVDDDTLADRAVPVVIKDPAYGEALFYFYQTRYFTSITNLLVAQHFGRLRSSEDEAEILRGGLFLSYGLHKEASEIFAKVIQRGATPAVRDRGWFYLAKFRYQRGYLAQAEDAVNRITHWLMPELEEERILLKANLLMAREDYAGAAKELELVRSKTGPALYARFNLGVALIKSGQAERGTALLDEVGTTPAQTEEYRSLKDKANLALGFWALQNEKPELARTYLKRVRLNGMLASKALLGFGWSSAALKQPQAALVPWTELAARAPADSAVLEAKLAVPYAYAELGALGRALDGYKQAVAAFERENADLDESIAAIRSGKLIAGLMERNPGEDAGWFWNITGLPEIPHAEHLTQIMAQHEFQEAFKNYRDLKFLARNLAQWQERLNALQDARQRDAEPSRAQQEQLTRLDPSGARIADLDKRLQAMAPRVAKLLAEQQQYVQEIAVAALKEQKDRVAAYTTEARFAIAQLHDRARTAREGTDAATPQ
jgi:hypothetical protein